MFEGQQQYHFAQCQMYKEPLRSPQALGDFFCGSVSWLHIFMNKQNKGDENSRKSNFFSGDI